MSALTVHPGDVVVLDPNDKRVVVFDWDLENLATSVEIASYTHTITAIRQSGATAMTKDNEAKLTAVQATAALGRTVSVDNRATRLRLLATTATLNDEYEVACQIITNESPAQQKEQSLRVLIQDR